MAVSQDSQKHLVVLGAGVIGLTIAYLAATDPDVTFKLTVIARDMPQDSMDSQAWASPFAVSRSPKAITASLTNVSGHRGQIGHLWLQDPIEERIFGNWHPCEVPAAGHSFRNSSTNSSEKATNFGI
jgi:glycine/D-amino acid oxidase-like deaminating enzyme